MLFTLTTTMDCTRIAATWTVLFVLWMIFCVVSCCDPVIQHGAIRYSRSELLSLRPTPGLPHPLIATDIPIRRKRGKRGGLKARLRRRPTRPPLPSIVFLNAQSLRKKMDELHIKTRTHNVFRETCVIACCETWLNASVPDHDVLLDGFSLYRSDRTKASGKEGGGKDFAFTLTLNGVLM